MNAKEVKRFLEQYAIAMEQVASITKSIERIEASIDSISIDYSGMPHGSGKSDKVARQAVKLADLKAKRIRERMAAELKAQEVEDVIYKLEDPRFLEVIRLRYIEHMKWDAIASAMCYEVSHVSGRLHGSALQAIAQIIDNDTMEYND